MYVRRYGEDSFFSPKEEAELEAAIGESVGTAFLWLGAGVLAWLILRSL